MNKLFFSFTIENTFKIVFYTDNRKIVLIHRLRTHWPSVTEVNNTVIKEKETRTKENIKLVICGG